MTDECSITCYITAEDERYPTLVIQGDFGSAGYSVDKHTGELERICICAARSDSECCCGAWITSADAPKKGD